MTPFDWLWATARAMFERPHHQRIARVLEALDAEMLRECGCLFGGGTAMTLRYGEYRESVDLDFLVSDLAGYRQLRQALTGPQGIGALVRTDATLTPTREVRADQYGVRTMLGVDAQAIKFEIVLEARITLTPPGNADVVCGVATLTPLDMAAAKLLANADRWADDGVFSRDLIDLAMMAPKRRLFSQAAAKAQGAYGDAVFTNLYKAIESLKGRAGRLDRCMHVMGMQMPKAVVWERIRALARMLPKVASN